MNNLYIYFNIANFACIIYMDAFPAHLLDFLLQRISILLMLSTIILVHSLSFLLYPCICKPFSGSVIVFKTMFILFLTLSPLFVL